MAKKTAPAARKAAPAKHASAASHDDDKVFALLGVGLPLLGYVILLLAKKDSAYAKFYGKQGVVLFVAAIVAMVAGMILAIIPFIGWAASVLLNVLILILWVVGIINALSGEVRDLPVIGVYAGKI